MTNRRCAVLPLLVFLLVVAFASPAEAYIGPGAGFAFLGSTFVFLLSILMALATIALWPLQWALRRIRGRGVRKNARTRRVVIVGLDGLEPSLAERYMAEGKMPHLKALAESGSYSKLGTTLPSLSPVAWSTFQTGVNPGAHNIFDFLTRDKRTCLPLLASSEVQTGGRVRIGPFSFKRRSPQVVITRKSEPFWKILGRYGIFSNILRIPISYPPEKFFGNILGAMCTPDLKGTQGSFSFFTTRGADGRTVTGGTVVQFARNADRLEAKLDGPPHPSGSGFIQIPIALYKMSDGAAELEISGSRTPLSLNTFSPWIELEFKAPKLPVVSGICRFCLRECGSEVSLYASPVHIHPERPALPIASPLMFARWLARRIGLYGTLGLMEDTWGRNERALDDARFLDQAYSYHEERERMFFEALQRTREGVCACVFDASDRIQHMFWRYLDDKHPSPREEDPRFREAIPEMYQKMDALIGRVKEKISPKDVLIILSDHGFSSFRRGINLNSWLLQNGYLTLKGGRATGRDYFADVDWSKTRAFAVGLTGMYINVAGREASGIVPESEAQTLKDEIARKLEVLCDPQDGTQAIARVYDSTRVYRGLYADQAPDLIMGYTPGYRCSWESITGAAEAEVFSDNVKAWSGDHHVDPKRVPGVFFSNWKLTSEQPHIIDIAPTVLNLFAIKVPPHMEGKVIL